jgi:hypothetical protein
MAEAGDFASRWKAAERPRRKIVGRLPSGRPLKKAGARPSATSMGEPARDGGDTGPATPFPVQAN